MIPELKTSGQSCPVCRTAVYREVDFASYAMPTASANPSLNVYTNAICDGCGSVRPLPFPSPESLAEHYKNDYCQSDFAIEANGNFHEPPIQIPWSGYSYQRARSFFEAVNKIGPDAVPKESDTIVDFGAYQGMFLYAARQIWGCDGIAYDFNHEGIEFARNAFGFKDSRVAEDIYSDEFGLRVRYAVAVQAFEHLDDPRRFLEHVRDRILMPGGWIYIEVPNLFGFPLSEPRHYVSYTEKSLQFLLTSSGFKVKVIWIGGYPHMPGQMWANDRQNLYCLAQLQDSVSEEVSAVPALGCSADVYVKLRKSYRAHSFRYAASELSRSLRSVLRACIHVTGFALTDLLPPALQRRVNFQHMLDTAISLKNKLLER